MAKPKPRAASASAADTADDAIQLRALEPIRADGVDYAPGDELELGITAAEPLLASGAAELV